MVEENGDEGVSAPLPIAIVDRRSGEGLGSSMVSAEDHFDLGEAGKVVAEPVLSTVSSSARAQVSPRCSDVANLVWADVSGGGALETVADRSAEGVEAISWVLVADAALVSLPDSFNPSSGVDSEFPVQLAGSVSPCLLADINGDVATVLSICGDTMAANGMVSEEGLVSSAAREALRPPPTDGRRQPPMSLVEPALVAGRDGSLPNAGGGLPSGSGGLDYADRVGGHEPPLKFAGAIIRSTESPLSLSCTPLDSKASVIGFKYEDLLVPDAKSTVLAGEDNLPDRRHPSFSLSSPNSTLAMVKRFTRRR
ncbi:hypothetical protein Dimus_030485 [Dionaea muscipula]